MPLAHGCILSGLHWLDWVSVSWKIGCICWYAGCMSWYLGMHLLYVWFLVFSFCLKLWIRRGGSNDILMPPRIHTIHVYIYIYMFSYVCVCVYIYIYIYIYIYTNTPRCPSPTHSPVASCDLGMRLPAPAPLVNSPDRLLWPGYLSVGACMFFPPLASGSCA